MNRILRRYVLPNRVALLMAVALASALLLGLAACSPTTSVPSIDVETHGASGPSTTARLVDQKLPGRATQSRMQGSDLNLGMEWESHIAVNRANPLQVAVVQGSTVRLSQDGGKNFGAGFSVGSALPLTHTSAGDGSLAFDGEGRLFMSFLGNPTRGGGWDTFVAQIDPVAGTVLGVPANVSDQIGLPSTMTSDKPWIAVDPTLGDTFAGQLYVVWAVTGGSVSGDWDIWAARSSDQGATWFPSVRSGFGWGPVSPWDAADGQVWNPHVAVGANGWVWVSYHAQGGEIEVPGVNGGTPDGVSGQVPILLSDDGGISFSPVTPAFGPGEADITRNAKHRPGRISDLGIWTRGSTQAWVLPDPFNSCLLYVVTADDPDNDPRNGDPSDVVMATSIDCGATWNHETVDGGPDQAETWQLFPSAAIDPHSGFVAVTFYDNRNASDYPPGIAGNSQFDLFVRYRDNGGFWNPAIRVNDSPIDADNSTTRIGSGSPSTFRWGEYHGVAYGECTARMVWTGNPVNGGDSDTYYGREPEAGGDVDPPTIFCPADVVLGCGDPTDPAATGMAVADDDCDVNPRVTFLDEIIPGSCPVGDTVQTIHRNWGTADEAGNVDGCLQRIRTVDAACCAP